MIGARCIHCKKGRPNLNEFVGRTFNRLTILGLAPKEKNRRMVMCRCECGTLKALPGTFVINGYIKSCGCLLSEKARAFVINLNTTHGMGGTSTYRSWSSMRGRCINKNNQAYGSYGGRGITVCERWNSFEAFYADMGARPRGMSLDRINNNGNYEPSNCRWATHSEQQKNRRPFKRSPNGTRKKERRSNVPA